MSKLKEILFEAIKSARMSGVLQKLYLRTAENKDQAVYFLSVSNVPSKPELSEGFIDYMAIVENIDEDAQELVSRLLKSNATIVTRTDDIDPAIFVEKLPILITLDKSKNEAEVIAYILNGITKMLSLKKESVIKIIRSVIKEDNTELIEAYKMVSRK